MRKFTTEHTVYSFDELTTEAKAIAIEQYRESIVDDGYDDLEEYMQESLYGLLGLNKIKSDDATVRYSLGYSQGDGASFTGAIEWGAWRANVTSNSFGNHYSHYNTVDVTDMTSLKTDKDAPDATVEKLDAIVKSIGKELAVNGYAYMDAITNDEAITKNIKENNYEFNSDGTMA